MSRFKGKLTPRTRARLFEYVNGDPDLRPTSEEMVQFVRDQELKWPTKRVTWQRVHHELLAMGCYFDPQTLLWHPEPPPPPKPEDVATAFLKALEDEKSGGSYCFCDECCHHEEADARDDAIDDAINLFKRHFGHLLK